MYARHSAIRTSLLAGFAVVFSACSDGLPTSTTSLPAPVVVASQAPNDYVVLLRGPSDSALGAAALDRIVATTPSLRTASRIPTSARLTLTGNSTPAVEHLVALGGAVLRVTASEASALTSNRDIAVIEPVRTAVALGTTRTATTSWAMDRVDQAALPLDGYLTRLATAGSGARVAIFDTGIRWTHQQLSGRVVSGYDAFANKTKVSGDSMGHGSAVAGTSTGATLGLANAAQLIDIRVLNAQGSGTSVELLRGVDFLLAEQKKAPTIPIVANFSLGFAGGSVIIDSAVTRLIRANITVVAAAGNDNKEACTVSPARVPEAITVGATDQKDARASFSNYGTCVDIFAPGVSVTAPWGTADNALVSISGTSLSAPVVTGAVATLLAANPKATPSQVSQWIRRDAVNNKLTGLPSGSPNALLQLKSVDLTGTTTTPTPPTPTPTPVTPAPASVSATFTVSCTGLTCVLTSTATGADALKATYTWTLAPNVVAKGVALQKLNVRYGAAGTYPTRLDVTDASGKTTTSTQNITVKP